MEKHNFVTIADLSKEKIMYLLEMAQEFVKHPNRELLKGKVVATFIAPLLDEGILRDANGKVYPKCEMIVVIENFMTSSAKYADILLPDLMTVQERKIV